MFAQWLLAAVLDSGKVTEMPVQGGSCPQLLEQCAAWIYPVAVGYTQHNTDLKAILDVATLGLTIAWITTVSMPSGLSEKVHLPAVWRHLFPLTELHCLWDQSSFDQRVISEEQECSYRSRGVFFFRAPLHSFSLPLSQQAALSFSYRQECVKEKTKTCVCLQLLCTAVETTTTWSPLLPGQCPLGSRTGVSKTGGWVRASVKGLQARPRPGERR